MIGVAYGAPTEFRWRGQLPAFPGAEGYGAFTPGGRGGKVLFVTTLDDYDPSEGEAPIPGSFRQAVETPGPRTVLFRVSGTIFLKSRLAVTQPFLTSPAKQRLAMESALPAACFASRPTTSSSAICGSGWATTPAARPARSSSRMAGM